MSAREAKEELFKQVEQQISLEMSAYIKEQEEEAKSKAADMSRDIIANAINRYAQEEVTERTVTVVDLPSEEMKGRETMCGIVGYVGKEQAAPILLDGLERLEYRGYDSAGLAVLGGRRGLQVKKSKGRLSVLKALTDNGRSLTGTLGIGHTRWATHGEPNDINSHPHLSEGRNIAVVHNGIIENYV